MRSQADRRNAPALARKHYRTDESLKSMLPALSEFERQELKAQIKKEGRCLSPFVVWREQSVLVDGHHRDEIIAELEREGVEIQPPKIIHKSFRTRYSVVRWMIHLQNGRRNWTPAQRAATVLRNIELIRTLRAEAKARMFAGRKQNPSAHAPEGDTRRFLSRLAGVGEGTISAVERVLKSGNERVINRLLVERKVSIREARALVADAEKRARLEQRAKEASGRLPPLNLSAESAVDQVLLADVLDGLKVIEPESVSLVFTSPPYALPSIRYPRFEYGGNYERHLAWLKRVWISVSRTMKNGARLVVNCDATTNREDDAAEGDIVRPVYADIVNQMRDVGLRFYGEFCWFKQHVTGSRPSWGTYCSCRNPRIRRNHEYLLVFSKGPSMLEGDPTLCDLTPEEFERWTVSHWYLQPERRNLGGHVAAFPEALAERVIRLFSYVGDIVLDPFAGTGTVPFVARKFARRFIGIDNAEEYVRFARGRVASLADLQRPSQLDGSLLRAGTFNHVARPSKAPCS